MDLLDGFNKSRKQIMVSYLQNFILEYIFYNMVLLNRDDSILRINQFSTQLDTKFHFY